MTDVNVSLPRFNDLNQLRPANASFGEVVSVEVYFNGENLGYTKRKSISVPPSSNAWWNFVACRSMMVEKANELGIQRRHREALYSAIEQAIRWIHDVELRLVYEMDGKGRQYYDLHLTHDGEHIEAFVHATDSEETSNPLFSVVVL